MIICNYIMLDFLVLIIIQQFEDYYFNPNNPLENFIENLDEFRRVWSQYTENYQGSKIHIRFLIPFLSNLRPPIGKEYMLQKYLKKKILEFCYEKNKLFIAKEILKMNLMM